MGRSGASECSRGWSITAGTPSAKISSGAYPGCPTVLAGGSSGRGGLQDRFDFVFSFVAGLLLAALTLIALNHAFPSLTSTDQQENLRPEPFGWDAGRNGRDMPLSGLERQRGILESKGGFVKVLGAVVSQEGFGLRVESSGSGHRPFLAEPDLQKDDAFPYQLHQRPPP